MQKHQKVGSIEQQYKSKLIIILICLNISLGSFYYGYSLAYLATIPIETIIKVFSIDLQPSVASGLLNGCIPVGGFLGAMGSSIIINHFSRR
jgi:hypothetical protein